VFEYELQGREPLIGVSIGSIDGTQRGWQRPSGSEGDRFDSAPRPREDGADVLAADYALLGHDEFAVEEGRGEALTPDLLPQLIGEPQRQFVGPKLAVGFQRARQGAWGQPFASDPFELRRDLRKRIFRNAKACGMRVSAKAKDRARRALGDEIDRVTQMKARNGSTRAAQLAVPGARKD